MYKPVMEIISETIMDNLDSLVMKAVHEIGVEVDKEELIRALKYDRDQYEKGFRDGVASVQEWIPVEEKLPETYENAAGTRYSEAVIVWTSGSKAMIAVYDGTEFLCPARYWEAEGEAITHWMPLPQPPEREE